MSGEEESSNGGLEVMRALKNCEQIKGLAGNLSFFNGIGAPKDTQDAG